MSASVESNQSASPFVPYLVLVWRSDGLAVVIAQHSSTKSDLMVVPMLTGTDGMVDLSVLPALPNGVWYITDVKDQASDEDRQRYDQLLDDLAGVVSIDTGLDRDAQYRSQYAD